MQGLIAELEKGLEEMSAKLQELIQAHDDLIKESLATIEQQKDAIKMQTGGLNLINNLAGQNLSLYNTESSVVIAKDSAAANDPTVSMISCRLMA